MPGTVHTKLTTAYFSSEFATRSYIPTYSGGLGTLAGDTAKIAADWGLDFVGVTLLYPRGYATQQGHEQPWSPKKAGLVKLDDIVEVPFGDRTIRVGCWVEPVISPINGNMVPILRLDTNVAGNKEEDKHVTDRLYDNSKKLEQFAVLGIGGTLMVQQLGYKVTKYHMNEGHSCLGSLVGLRQKGGRLEDLAKELLFFNHSVVGSARPSFWRGDLEWCFRSLASCNGKLLPEEVSKCVGYENVDSNLFAAEMCGRKMYGVALQHRSELKKLFPGFEVGYVTNGVHAPTWVTDRIAELYDRKIDKEWRHDHNALRKAASISPSDFWNAHMADKEEGMRELFELTKIPLNPEVFTVGFARRAAPYKEFELLLNPNNAHLLEGLPKPIQYLMAGKSHPADVAGRQMFERAAAVGASLNTVVKFVSLDNYDMDLARLLFKVTDLWLNHPQKGQEACGTSGMKAALNGKPNLSKPEGWYYEAVKNALIREGETGWVISEENAHLSTVEGIKKAQSAYYDGSMADMMPKIASTLGPEYHAGRMMDEYVALWDGNSTGKNKTLEERVADKVTA